MTAAVARRRVSGAVAALTVLVAGLAACGGSGDSPAPARPPDATITYAPHLTEDLYLPPRTARVRGAVPLVVLVPGGSWQTADPTGLAGLAAGLAARGVAAAPAHVRAAADGVTYPEPVDDVRCAVAAAVREARDRGLHPDPVAVLGHSSGAHLAALAVLAVDDRTPPCAAPLVRPDALVGLSGPYDIRRVPDLAAALLGGTPDDDPAAWASANPVLRAAERPGVPVLLLHGADDPLVPVDFTAQLAQALRDGGHPTTVEVVPGADHDTIYRADVSARRIASWLLGLAAR